MAMHFPGQTYPPGFQFPVVVWEASCGWAGVVERSRAGQRAAEARAGELRANCRVQMVRPLEAESRLVGTGGGEALLAYCLVDLSPVENTGKGLRSHVSRASKRRAKLARERSPRGFLTLGNRREPGGDLGFQSSPKVLNGSAKSRKVVFGSIRSPS